MDTTVLILQIVTILVSVSSLVFNLLSARLENNKKNYIKVVTEQRLKNKSIVRESVKILLAYSNIQTLNLLNEEILSKSVESAAAIETVLKDIYPEDNRVLIATNNLIDEMAKQINAGNNEQAVLIAREKLQYEFSVYDLADWRFIKKQSNGKKIDGNDFDEIYRNTRNEYKK
ncbi:MAG: hypothetical protein J1G07_01815 [Clostridiales bacterium]|nr:hypothetical protein [Clostridiales bacterium]